MTENIIEIAGFKYKILIHHKNDGVNFDIVDNVITKSGKIEQDIIASGHIDKYGRLKVKDIYCDIHAATALGELIQFVYDHSF